MNFASDNTAPVAPAILDAIVAANAGYAAGAVADQHDPAVEQAQVPPPFKVKGT